MKNFFQKIKQKWGYSVIGLYTAFKEEKSLWAYLALTIGLIILGVFAKLNATQWALLIFIILTVICVEIINTALEAAVDTISFQYNVKVKKIKDIASGATLVITIAALIGIVLIFVSAFLGGF